MKRLLLSGVVLSLLGCSPFAKKEAKGGDPESANDSTLTVGMQMLSGVEAEESAYVTKAQVVCGTSSTLFTFTEANQSAVLFQDVTDCRVDLKSFVVTIGTDSLTYDLTGRLSQGFAVYDAVVAGNVVDTKLATGSVDISDVCLVHETCDFKKAKVKFSYSELLGEKISLDNNLAVSALEVLIEKEPAPKCKVEPRFEQNGANEPEMVIDISQCVDTFAHKDIQYAIKKHEDGNVYGIEGLHADITAANKSFNAANPFEIRLTVADLLAISGQSDIFAALAMDLVIPTRNKDGKSIKYYIIDNNCKPLIANPPLGGCETAFAFGASTFIDLGITNSRWGWQLDVQAGDTNKTTPIWAGAGQNNTANGTQVGVLRWSYDGTTLTVTFDLYPEYGMNVTQLYAGLGDVTTTAPGQFGNIHEDLNLATLDTYTIAISGESIKVVAHAEVCDAAN